MSDYRRPSPKWCTDTAIRLLQVGCREPGREPQLLDADAGRKLVEAAALLDAFGQAVTKGAR